MKKILLYSLLSVFLVFFALSVAFYSGWGQNLARSFVLSALKKEGFQAEVESFEGIVLPDTITLKNFSFALPDGSHLSIEKLKAQISFLYFLKNEFRISKLQAFEVVWKKATQETVSRSSSSSLLPMSFSIGSFEAFNVRLDTLEPIHLQGRLSVGAGLKRMFLDLQADRENDTLSLLFRKRRDGFFSFKADVHIVDSSWLSPFYPSSLEGALDLRIKAEKEPDEDVRGRLSGIVQLKKAFKALQAPFHFKGKFHQTASGNWLFSPVSIQGNDLELKGEASLDSTGNLVIASGDLETNQLFLPPLQGKLLARFLMKKENDQWIGKTIAKIPHAEFKKLKADDVEFIIDSIDREGTFTSKGPEWTAHGDFSWQQTLLVKNIKLEAPHIKATGEGEFLQDGSVACEAQVTIDNLHILEPFFPKLDPYGQLTLKTTWNGSHLTFDLLASELYLKSIFFEQAALYSDLQDPFGELKGIVSIDVEKGKFRDLAIDSALIETVIGGENWPFTLFAEGVWNRDFESHFAGVWHFEKGHFTSRIEDFHGLFYSHPFTLDEAVQLDSTPESLTISQTRIALADASVEGKFSREKSGSEFSLKLQRFPLDFLSINPLEVAVNGLLDFEGMLVEKKSDLTGSCKAAIREVEISRLGETESITAEGFLEANLKNHKLHIDADLSTRGEELTSIKIDLPVSLSTTPFSFSVLSDGLTEGSWFFNGRIEDFLDFFNLRSHWLQGNARAELTWSGSIKKPGANGFVRIQDGYYENYSTGTQLTSLEAELIAERGKLLLKSLRAEDMDQMGSLIGDGSIDLRWDKKFPFKIHLACQNFHFVQLGIASANTNGALEITGNLDSALAKGELHVTDSSISLNEKLTKSPPILEVVYLNAQKPIERPAASPIPYPLNLDIAVDTPNGITISGRGLQSTWKGTFSLKGTESAPKPSGRLDLEQGEFSFSGRLFKLTRGALVFTPESAVIPRIDLSGTTEQHGISIIVNLEGPLNRPQLTFHSVPQLPLSSIISYLLFGQDISEINGLQALQLATAVTNIAGQSPDVLESMRKTLGIDRLRIVSEPGSEGNETVAIQVGKYITEGVIVSISQSTENAAPNIIIEVDIGAGFFFQAETDQVQEQGKFGIKWNRNY